MLESFVCDHCLLLAVLRLLCTLRRGGNVIGDASISGDVGPLYMLFGDSVRTASSM